METLRVAKFTLTSEGKEFNSFQKIEMPNNTTIQGAINELNIPGDVEVYLGNDYSNDGGFSMETKKNFDSLMLLPYKSIRNINNRLFKGDDHIPMFVLVYPKKEVASNGGGSRYRKRKSKRRKSKRRKSKKKKSKTRRRRR